MVTKLDCTFISALQSLPDPDRQLLTLREVDGLNAAGIGEALGISRAQARIGLLHARVAMRVSLLARIRAVAA